MEILRKLKADPELQAFGKKVVRIRGTKNGGLLFELGKSDDDCGVDYAKVVQNSIGSNGTVKTLGQMETVEIRYIDAETQTSDVEKDLRDLFTELDGVTFETKMTKSFNGMQTASVKLPTKLATLVAARDKIRIGWTICSVKIQIPNRGCLAQRASAATAQRKPKKNGREQEQLIRASSAAREERNGRKGVSADQLFCIARAPRVI